MGRLPQLGARQDPLDDVGRRRGLRHPLQGHEKTLQFLETRLGGRVGGQGAFQLAGLRLAGVSRHLRDIFQYSGFDQIFEIEAAAD
jgi:hypothetical protein